MKLPLRRLKVAILKLPLLYVHVVVGTAAKLVNVTFRLCEAVDRLIIVFMLKFIYSEKATKF